MNGGNGTRVLVRPRKGRMVAGVCAGIAEYSGLDVTLVRVIVAVVSVITGGTGALAYLAAWMLKNSSSATSPPATGKDSPPLIFQNHNRAGSRCKRLRRRRKRYVS